MTATPLAKETTWTALSRTAPSTNQNPEADEYVVGPRDELCRVWPVVVSGARGIGKTSLLLHARGGRRWTARVDLSAFEDMSEGRARLECLRGLFSFLPDDSVRRQAVKANSGSRVWFINALLELIAVTSTEHWLWIDGWEAFHPSFCLAADLSASLRIAMEHDRMPCRLTLIARSRQALVERALKANLNWLYVHTVLEAKYPRIEVPGLDSRQVVDLAGAQGLRLDPVRAAELGRWTGGNPRLLRLCLSHTANVPGRADDIGPWVSSASGPSRSWFEAMFQALGRNPECEGVLRLLAKPSRPSCDPIEEVFASGSPAKQRALLDLAGWGVIDQAGHSGYPAVADWISQRYDVQLSSD